MTYRDEYDRRHFKIVERTQKQMDEIVVQLYFIIQPVIVKELNRFIAEKKQPISFSMVAKLLGLTTLRLLDNNVRMHPESERDGLMEMALVSIVKMIQNYDQIRDLRGDRPDPKTFNFDDTKEDLK